MKAVADTNLYVSALMFGGVPKRLLEAAIDGQLDLYISPQIIDETIRILRDKFKRSPEQLEEVRTYLAVARLVEPTAKLQVVKADPKDDIIVECAVACGADVILSGDHHLLDIKEYMGIKMMSVGDFLRRGVGI